MAVEKDVGYNRSMIEIYERMGIGGVHIDRREPTSKNSAPRERIRSSPDVRRKKLHAKRQQET